MKKVVANKWVKALRSKKYKQTVECLHYEGMYCCLGVLSDISKLGQFDENGIYRTKTDTSKDFLTADVLHWAGMFSNAGYLRPRDGNEICSLDPSLADLNDEGWSFKKIANYIEKNYRRL